MSYVTVGQENSAAIRIYYEDHGQGAPVVLVHGYLLDGHSWEKQETALLAAGYRVITYDRRGFGASSRPSVGYDYDTLAADLAALLDQLDLREVVLAGFCAGTGEVIRYLGTYGHGRVRAAALLAPLPAFLPRAGDNPGGIDRGVVGEFISQIGADRPAATKTFLDRSYNLDLLGGIRVSDQAWQNSFHVAVGASAAAVAGCAAAWLEDFRGDLARIIVPVLVVQGGQDRITPAEITGSWLPGLLRGARPVVIPDGPHAIIWTHADEVNLALLGFIGTLLPAGRGLDCLEDDPGDRPGGRGLAHQKDERGRGQATGTRKCAASPVQPGCSSVDGIPSRRPTWGQVPARRDCAPRHQGCGIGNLTAPGGCSQHADTGQRARAPA